MEEDSVIANAMKTQLATFQEMEKENRKLVKDNEYLRYYRCQFCIKTFVVTPHLNRLIETVQMGGHNIWF